MCVCWDRNLLEYLPDWVCDCRKIEMLDITHNLLSELPSRLLTLICHYFTTHDVKIKSLTLYMVIFSFATVKKYKYHQVSALLWRLLAATVNHGCPLMLCSESPSFTASTQHRICIWMTHQKSLCKWDNICPSTVWLVWCIQERMTSCSVGLYRHQAENAMNEHRSVLVAVSDLILSSQMCTEKQCSLPFCWPALCSCSNLVL